MKCEKGGIARRVFCCDGVFRGGGIAASGDMLAGILSWHCGSRSRRNLDVGCKSRHICRMHLLIGIKSDDKQRDILVYIAYEFTHRMR